MQLQLASTESISPSSVDQTSTFTSGTGEPQAAASAARTRTILFVEDDEDLLQLTRAFLKSSGYKVLGCSNGEAAAEVFRKVAHVDLLLTDLRMPGMSGLELARDLTVLKPDLPVLMISGNGLTEALAGEIAARGWYFLPKPWRFPDLLSMVHRLLPSEVGCEPE